MKSAFKIWTTNRQNCMNLIEKFDLEQLNHLPKGFSNNLIWNLGHIVVIQQRLVYSASFLPMHASDALFEQYKSGTVPTQQTTQQEVDELKVLMNSLMEQTKVDFEKGIFEKYKELTTSTGFHLDSIEDAIQFNNYHESMHLGFMYNIRKFV